MKHLLLLAILPSLLSAQPLGVEVASAWMQPVTTLNGDNLQIPRYSLQRAYVTSGVIRLESQYGVIGGPGPEGSTRVTFYMQGVLDATSKGLASLQRTLEAEEARKRAVRRSWGLGW